jgi:hypothetical protein
MLYDLQSSWLKLIPLRSLLVKYNFIIYYISNIIFILYFICWLKISFTYSDISNIVYLVNVFNFMLKRGFHTTIPAHAPRQAYWFKKGLNNNTEANLSTLTAATDGKYKPNHSVVGDTTAKGDVAVEAYLTTNSNKTVQNAVPLSKTTNASGQNKPQDVVFLDKVIDIPLNDLTVIPTSGDFLNQSDVKAKLDAHSPVTKKTSSMEE